MLNKKFLTPEQAAALLDRTPSTLCQWREKGIGPAYYQLPEIGKRVFYKEADIEAWIERGRKDP